MEEIILYGGKVKIYRNKRKSFFEDKEETKKILSVGRVNGCLAKPALKFWASGCAAEYMFNNWDLTKKYSQEQKERIAKIAYTAFCSVVNKKAKKGRVIHEFAEDYANGLTPKMPEDHKVLNGVNAFLEWFNQTDIKPIENERIVYSKKYKIVGVADQLGVNKRKKTKHILDFKTVTMYKRAKDWDLSKWPDGFARDKDGEMIKYPVFLEPKIQISCYRAMIMEETGDYYGESYILRFDQETGEFDKEVVSVEFQDEAWKMFSQHQKKVKNFLDKHEVKIYGNKKSKTGSKS